MIVSQYLKLITSLLFIDTINSQEDYVADDQRIFYGDFCPSDEYKSIVSLRRINGVFHQRHICAGTLLNPWWVITAAHCWNSTVPLYVAAGITKNLETEPKISKVNKGYIHPKYEDDWKQHDVALLHLLHPIYQSRQIKYGKIGNTNLSEFITNNCPYLVVKGWGFTEHYKDVVPENKMQCIVIPRTNSCAEYLFIPLEEGNVICSLPKTKKNSCFGDSGGPVKCRGVHVGIVSWGRSVKMFADCEHVLPDVYMRIDAFLDFITNTMQIGSSNRLQINYYLLFEIFILLTVFI